MVILKIVKFAVIGMGRMGLWHAKNLRFRVPGAKLVAVADLDKASAKRGSLETGVPSFADYRQLLSLKELDAVCVVTTTDTHAPIAADAAEHGLNVFVEKPMAITTKQADRLESIVKRRGVKLQVGFMRRFDPAYARAEQHVLRGDIGKPIVFKSTSRDPFPPPVWACDPKHGGGLQIEMHAHDYDLARWFMKNEVNTVFTKAECLVFPQLRKIVSDFVDNTLITLGFVNRAIGVVDGSLNARYGYDVRAEVYGTDGMITVGSIQRVPLVLYTPAGGNAETSYLGDRETPHFAQRFDTAYLAEMRSFVNTIRNDLRPMPSLNEGRAALDIGLAAFKSTERKQQVRVIRS